MSANRFEAIKNIINKKNIYCFSCFGENCKIIFLGNIYRLYMSGSLIDTASNIDKFKYILIAK